MSYDPAPHLIKVKTGQLYLPVRDRLVWFREEHPDGNITTELVYADYDNGFYVVRAVVSLPSGGSATGYKSESNADFPGAALEKAETGAVGRALAALGYGTQFATELTESDVTGDGHASGTRTATQPRAQPSKTDGTPPSSSTSSSTPAVSGSQPKAEPGKTTTPAMAALARLQKTCAQVGRTPPLTVREMNDLAREHGLVEMQEGAHPSPGWIDSIRDAVWRSVTPVDGKASPRTPHVSRAAAYDESES